MQSYIKVSSFKDHCRPITIENSIRFCYKLFLYYYRAAILPITKELRKLEKVVECCYSSYLSLVICNWASGVMQLCNSTGDLKQDARCSPGYFPPSNARVFSNLHLLLSITQYSSDITSKLGYSAIISSLRLLLSIIQYNSSDITSTARTTQSYILLTMGAFSKIVIIHAFQLKLIKSVWTEGIVSAEISQLVFLLVQVWISLFSLITVLFCQFSHQMFWRVNQPKKKLIIILT